jgi:hypothetical protein
VVISEVGPSSTTNMILIRGELMVAAKAPKAPALEVVLIACWQSNVNTGLGGHLTKYDEAISSLFLHHYINFIPC